jgi:hypothetical protein
MFLYIINLLLDMDKININNLFPSSSDNFKPLDVESLFNFNEQKNRKKMSFNVERLVRLREERKMKVLSQYEKVFGFCLNKITLANNMNKLEVVYDLPEAMYGSFEYNVVDCLMYIDEKLLKMELDTLIINENTIYISWVDLGKDKNIKDKDTEYNH